jgi:hypothetical protein
VANTVAELLIAWRNFKADALQTTKDIAKASRDVLREVSLDPLKKYAKDIKDKNAILYESYNGLSTKITAIKDRINNSTNAAEIERYTSKLEQMNKAAAKHPGNLDKGKSGGGGGGGDKGGKGIGDLVQSVTGLFGKSMTPFDVFTTAIKKGATKQQEIEDQKRMAAPTTGVGVLLSKAPKDELSKAGASMDPANLGMAGIANNMTAQVETVSEKWGRFTEKLQTGLADAGLAFMPIISRLLDFGLKISDTLLPMIMTAVAPIMEIINSIPIEAILENVLTIVGAIITAIGPIMEQLKPLFDSIFEMLTPLMQNITDFIVVLVEGLAPIFALIAHIASAVLGPALVFIGKILGVVIDIVKWIAKIAMAILKPIIDFIALLIDGVMWLFGQSNEFSGKDTTGKMINPVDPKKDTSLTATQAGAMMDKGLAGAAKTATPTAINTGQSTHTKSATKTGSEVTSGGPRVININGVKFAEKIELSVISAKEGINHLEAQLQEMFLRILNSGAVIQ